MYPHPSSDDTRPHRKEALRGYQCECRLHRRVCPFRQSKVYFGLAIVLWLVEIVHTLPLSICGGRRGSTPN